MRVAYLTNAYPSVSHTFIRRELTELERQVGYVARFSIRPSPHDLVDPDDRREDDETFHVLQQPVARWVRAGLDGLRRPGRTLAGLRKAVRLGRKSYRGLPRHLIYLAEALLLLEPMQRQRIDHVHVHFGTNPTAVASILHAMGGPSYSFTVHGPDELDAPEAHKLGPKIEDSAFVVAITDFCAGQLRRWVGHDHWDKIRVVRCTVGDELFEQARPIDPSSTQLVAVGRLSAQKGQALLVEAFADAVARARGIEDRLRITGWISGEQVREELLASRAMVLPSFAEGLPVVIMEAFALRRPVLTTTIAGIPELVVDGENGVLIPSGSRARIIEGLHRIMRTPVEQLDQMGIAGQAAVRELHYTPVETAKLAEQIRRALEDQGARACSR